MSKGTGKALVPLEEQGLRETFLVALPAEMRDSLRLITLGLHGFAGRYGLLYGDSSLDRATAELVGLYRELRFLKGLTGQYERQSKGTKRRAVEKIRTLLEDAEAQAHRLVPEGWG